MKSQKNRLFTNRSDCWKEEIRVFVVDLLQRLRSVSEHFYSGYLQLKGLKYVISNPFQQKYYSKHFRQQLRLERVWMKIWLLRQLKGTRQNSLVMITKKNMCIYSAIKRLRSIEEVRKRKTHQWQAETNVCLAKLGKQCTMQSR